MKLQVPFSGDADLKLAMKSSIDSYKSLLDVYSSLGFSSVTHAEWFVCPRKDKTLLLRHDVDHDLERALAMAKVEAAAHVRSSYYLLPPGAYEPTENYYGRLSNQKIEISDRLIEVALEIQSLGHEIGIHNDFIQLGNRLGRDPGELISEQVSELRGAGIRVFGTASHGSKFARENGYTNYELFSDRINNKRPNNVILADGSVVNLYDFSYRSIGLVYEAYDVLADARLTDSGGLFTAFFRSEGAKAEKISGLVDLEWLQVKLESIQLATMLVHPEWWAPFDNSLTKPFGLFVNDLRTPFRVLIRGDCTSRRSVALNRDLFPNGVRVTANGKSPNIIFSDAIKGRAASKDDLEQVLDIESMPKALRQYYFDQIARNILEEEGDLLIMDSYADMNFELWEHQEGWKIWIHPKFIKNQEDFSERFKKIGRRSLEESVDDAVQTIKAVRVKNPKIPVLFLTQQVDFYKKLQNRTEFYKMGELVADRLPGVFVGGIVDESDLELADVGSCGPGQTLHFGAKTYRQMIMRALDSGLMADWNSFAEKNISVTSKKICAVDTIVDESNDLIKKDDCVNFPPKRVNAAAISFRINEETCGGEVSKKIDSAFKSFANYFKFPELCESSPKWIPCVIDIDELRDISRWENKIRKFQGGNRTRLKNKAINHGYYSKLFNWKQHIPDVCDINQSMVTRSGGAMRGSYLRSVDEMGGAPTRRYEFIVPKNHIHWGVTFGVFVQIKDHMQGDINVGEKLVGYISLRRFGDIACYSTFLGHGDHLNNGVMVLLHHDIAAWIGNLENPLTSGLRYLMYGAAASGGKGLQQWKERGGFKAMNIDAYVDRLPPGELGGEMFEIISETENG